MDFNNTVCVVTGGANGIGRCISEEFLKAGASVALIDTDGAALSRLAARYAAQKVLGFCGDIAEEAALIDFTSQIRLRFPAVNFIINNACISKKGILSGCGFDDFNYVLKIGVTAPYMLTKLLLDFFAPAAAIVNIASTRAFMSQADTESYSAAKGGISTLTHALSVSLKGRARVNAISPGWIDTGAFHEGESPMALSWADHKQHPAGRVGVPADIAKMAMYLCSQDAAFITGQNFVVDGGMTRHMIYHNDEGWTYEL